MKVGCLTILIKGQRSRIKINKKYTIETSMKAPPKWVEPILSKLKNDVISLYYWGLYYIDPKISWLKIIKCQDQYQINTAARSPKQSFEIIPPTIESIKQ